MRVERLLVLEQRVADGGRDEPEEHEDDREPEHEQPGVTAIRRSVVASPSSISPRVSPETRLR